MSKESSEARYVEVSARLNNINLLGAWLITALMLVATWGEWRRFAAVVVVQATLVPFNAWVTLSLLPRRDVKTTELVRTAVNLTGTIVVGTLTHWPLPIWLWLPFVALAFDHLGVSVARRMLLAMCTAQVVGALAMGVHWLYPLTFTVLAVFCSEVSRVRFQVIRGMLVTSDVQRRELEEAHRDLHGAHEKLTTETRARQQVEIELRQAQKLEAVGRLAAGIAHEINTPVQFVSDSIHFLRDGNADLLRLLDGYRGAQQSMLSGGSPQTSAVAIAKLEAELDADFLVEGLPEAAVRSLEGLSRIADIVRSMKDFAHPDQKEARLVDLNSAISSTLTIARSEYKHVANVELGLSTLPMVTCHGGEINQVVLNLVVNAAHAISDKQRASGEMGTIKVSTTHDDDHVVITIADSGCGIPPEVQEHIFEPFFTTKEVGRGTAQGLALARAIILRHGGTLSFTSEVGAGTSFAIRLPIEPRPAAAAAA